MKIVALQAENIKKLTAVEIRPDGNMVQITGANGQGKTSVLDAIWWALAGATHIQAEPIRKGADKARIRLDLGEIVVTRTFKSGGADGYTSSIAVENAEGGKFNSPQTMLDQLLGQLTFDPLAFTRMDAKGQFDSLAKFVEGVDFTTIAMLNKTDYDRRTELNRQAKEALAASKNIQVPANCPTAAVDVSALVEQMNTASKTNSDRERRRLNREEFSKKATEDLAKAERLVKEKDTEWTTKLNRLRAELKAAEGEAEAEIKQAFDEATKLREQAAATLKRIEDAGPLPALVDTDSLSQQIQMASQTNEAVESGKKRTQLEAQAKDFQEKADAMTKAISDREAEKQAKISAAKLPVPGITFGDGLVLFNGVPFDQASDAEQLRVSVGIAMALNPKLKVIRVRDGALLDEKSMALLSSMADANDYQVWIERVDSSGKVGFVLEDGHIKGQTVMGIDPAKDGGDKTVVTPVPVQVAAPAPAAAPVAPAPQPVGERGPDLDLI